MVGMDSKIIAFLKEQHLLSLAVCDEEGPYGASCFYAFDPEHIALIFASDPQTRHMQIIERDPRAAGTIHLCERTVAKIVGVQFRGRVHPATPEDKRLYLERFPYARAMRPTLWRIDLEWIKMTDNRLGFGTKIIWSRR